MLPSSRGHRCLVVHHLGSSTLLHHLRIVGVAHHSILLVPLAIRLESIEVELHPIAHT